MFRVNTDGTPRTPRSLQHRHRDTHTATLGAGGTGGAAVGEQHGDGGSRGSGWQRDGRDKVHRTQSLCLARRGWSVLPVPGATRGCDSTEGQSPPTALPEALAKPPGGGEPCPGVLTAPLLRDKCSSDAGSHVLGLSTGGNAAAPCCHRQGFVSAVFVPSPGGGSACPAPSRGTQSRAGVRSWFMLVRHPRSR